MGVPSKALQDLRSRCAGRGVWMQGGVISLFTRRFSRIGFAAETVVILADLYGTVQPFFFVCLIAELSLALWLLVQGVDETKWR